MNEINKREVKEKSKKLKGKITEDKDTVTKYDGKNK
jgi:hypothetical protein